MTHTDDFDQVIARAMRARPAPRRLGDLAARAMARAQHAKHSIAIRKARLGVLRRRNQLASVAACILVGLLIAIVFGTTPAVSYAPGVADVIAANPSLPDMGDIADSAAGQIDIVLICGGILLIAVLFVAIEQSTTAPSWVFFGWPATSQ